MLYLTYLISEKPKKIGVITEFYNEGCTLLASYLMIIYTDFTDNLEAKYKGGYLFIGIYLVNMAVNFIVIIIQTLRIIKRKIQAFLFRRKLAKMAFN